MIFHLSKLLLLSALTLGVVTPALSAEVRIQEGSSAAAIEIGGDGGDAVPALVADSVSISKWFWGAGGRTRVVQLCVVTMCIALFIMMRKLN